MSASNENVPSGTSEISDSGKGKGKAVEQPQLTTEDDDSEDESGAEEVRPWTLSFTTSALIIPLLQPQEVEEDGKFHISLYSPQ